MSIFFYYNNSIYPQGEKIVSADNRGLKYGDGLFETMKVHRDKIELAAYHFERLFSGMQLLKLDIPPYFTAGYFQNKILELYNKNEHTSYARVRLMIFRGDGSLSGREDDPDYILQSWDIGSDEELNSNGLIIDVYPDAKKSCDKFANVKSNSYLPYRMAALYAEKIKVNDCIILNTSGRICDTSIANIFIIKDKVIYTPPLSEGCIAGVMRRFIIEKLQHLEFKIEEKTVSIEELENADEVFLSNAIRGIRWVKEFRNKKYKPLQTLKLCELLKPLI